MKRKLGRSNIEVSAVGMGCWAIGGQAWRDGNPVGWGEVDDNESIRAIHRALDLGVTFFDTADVYGAGHSEEVLCKALSGKWDQVVLATKFSIFYDRETRVLSDKSVEPEYIRWACEQSLQRLGRDYIDLYQLHWNDCEIEKAADSLETLEALVEEGKIRYYGWSTDDPERARCYAQGEHCTAIQLHLNIFGGNEETLAVCEENNLACINRGPLAMGILTGKFTQDSTLPKDDVRSGFNFKEGPWADQIVQLDKIRNILTQEGRSLTQGALAWLWARSEKNIPIPGFKSVKQVEENAGAMQFGPLTSEEMSQINEALGR